jgi:glycerol-3-phosphate dehydrogenase
MKSDLAYAPLSSRARRPAASRSKSSLVEDACAIEPHLNPEVLAVYTVPDGTFDPLRLALAFAATAKKNGAEFRPYHQVKGCCWMAKAM